MIGSGPIKCAMANYISGVGNLHNEPSGHTDAVHSARIYTMAGA